MSVSAFPDRHIASATIDFRVLVDLDSNPRSPGVAYGEPSVSNWGAAPITRRGREIIVPQVEFSYVVQSVDYAG